MAKELKCEILETLIEFPGDGKYHNIQGSDLTFTKITIVN